jgi:hypothetical protein
MKPSHVTEGRFAVAAIVAFVVGCKSDLNQQLLERELRYQEDQIYQLQDELQDKAVRLESVASENASLRRQLGVSENDTLRRPGASRSRTGTPAPATVPPAIRVPDSGPAPPVRDLAPPALENIPPLPAKPASVPAADDAPPLDLPAPATTTIDPAARPLLPPGGPAPALPVAFGAPAVDAPPSRLVISAAATACFDADGDGTSDGLRVTFEPRDAEERLVAAPGAVTITASEASAPSTPLATWTIPAAQATHHFRRTSRLRGLHFELRWPAGPPAGEHVKLVVRVMPEQGGPLETDATIPATVR